MKKVKENLQPPFRQKDLLTLSGFVRHCKESGLDTDKEQLEYYEKLGLLYPAVRVTPGIVEYKRVLAVFDGKEEWRYTPKSEENKLRPKKVDPKTYYGYGGFYLGTPNWLDWYTERDMVIFPAQSKFRPWKEYEGSRVADFTTTKLKLSYESFYTGHQIFPLKELQSRLSITIKDETIFQDDQSWIKTGKKIRKFFANSPALLNTKIVGLYEVLSLLNNIFDLREDMVNY